MTGRLARLVPDVLRTEPRFRLLFVGQILSMVGDRVMLIVLPFAVLSAGGDTADVGLVVAAQAVPFVVFALAGGVIADRGDRRALMIASDLVRMATQATGGALLLTGAARPVHLALLAAAYGSAEAFFQPAMTGLVPQTLSGPEQYQAANALRSLTSSASMLAGPTIAGVLLAVARPGWALLFDAATFAASVAFLARLRVARQPRDGEAARFGAELRAGWQAVRRHDWILWFLGAGVVYTVVVLPSVYVLGPVLARDELGGAKAWAAIALAFGVGTITGDVVLLHWRPAHALRVAAALMALGSMQAVIFGSGLPLLAICAMESVAGVGVTISFSLWETSLAEHVPRTELSRVSSYDWMLTVGLTPVGMLLAAPFADAVGVHTALALMSAAGALAALGVLSVRSVRTLGRGTA